MPVVKFSPDELVAFREEYCKGATDAQFTLFIAECERRNLIPGQHIVFQLRTTKEWQPDIGASVFVKKAVKITTIDALRLVSQRTGEYEGQGQGEFYYLDSDGNPAVISNIPLPHPTIPNTPREPWAAAIPIYRKGFREPVKVVARFDAYAVLRKAQGGDMVLSDVWARRAPEMLLKCSEGAARRACFPEELAGLYLAEEFAREDAENKPEPVAADPKPLAEAPKAAVVPTVNHTPAQPTNEPRPEEKQRTKKNVKDVKIEEVILDKVEVVADHVEIDKPTPTVDVEINTAQSAANSPDNHRTESVQKMDNSKDNNTRLRELIAKGVDKDKLKQYILTTSGKEAVNQIPTETLKAMLTTLEESMAYGGKDLVSKLIEPKPVEAEEPF